MNEERIEELKNALRQIIQMVTERGQPLSPDLKAILVQVMEHVATRIQELRSQQDQATQQQDIDIPEQPPISEAMPSSNIEGFAYDDKTGRMYVRFLGKHPNRYGPIYQYENVPPNIFEIFRKGAIPAKTDGKNKWGRWWKGKYPSIGAAMYHLIKAGAYPYQRVG